MPVIPRTHRARVLSLMLALAAIATVAVAPGRVAQAAPPVNPTDGQISNAAAQKAALAAQVGRLSASVAQAQTQLRQLEAAKEMAEQKLAYALSKLADAKQASQQAARDVAAAQARVDAAQQQFTSFVQSTYMNGSIGGTTGSLLTASDPNVVLQQSALEQYESDHQLDAISNVKSATVAKSNADARARAAVLRQKAATDAATQAKADADAAVVSAIAQQKQLEAQLASNQTALQRAQEQLATLNNERAAYIAYQKRQAEIRAAQERARRLAEARARAAAAAAAAAERRREAAAAAAARRNHNGGGGGGSSSGGGGGGGGGYSAPSGGSWSPGAGQQAVNRAMQYLGWMYAWAGGNAYGPTYGVCAGDGAYNDCHIRGFDCSGLTIYGWAPYTIMPHYAASQYYSGSVHPSTYNLMPGDLVFWSSNGTVGGIHHVAMYIGNGNVIQAPQSGSVIQVTPLMQVDWGYFGATRPLT